jgi:glycosyl transferase family 92
VRAERWSSFRAYASKALGKPTFELEERKPRLRVAGELLAAFRVAREGGDWQTRLRDCLFAAGYSAADLTSPEHNESFSDWLSSGDPALRGALARFGEPDADAVERFAAFADAAEARTSLDPAAVLAFGSLFNFAAEPARLPFVPARPFRKLEELLGHDPPAEDSPSDSYRHHLAFARTLEEELQTGKVPVRDMLDLQSLIVDAARNSAFWSETRRAVEEAEPRPEPAAYLSVCAIYRDEGPYLHEWIEFHRLVGVERFFLYDNRSSDDHLGVLEPYVQDGTVVLHDWPMPQGQLAAYEHTLREYGAESRWIAFIDLDEFLFSPTGRPLSQLLVEYEEWPAVGVNWAVFGPSGHIRKPPGLVIESYLERLDIAANRTIKSVVDPARVTRCPGVHRFAYDRLGTVDENHYPIFGGRTKSVSFARLRINHYLTKSLEEYQGRAEGLATAPSPIYTGRAEQPDPAAVARRLSPEKLTRWEQRAERDETILQYLPALRRALDEGVR